MRRPPPNADGSSTRANVPGDPKTLLDTLRRGAAARLVPMIGEAQAALEVQLRRAAAGGNASDIVLDDLTGLSILRNQSTAYERRWQDAFSRRFERWPAPPVAPTAQQGAFSLVSEDQLHAQLVGQPVIEAMERRFADAIDVIDSRLWSLAASTGRPARPPNPFAPRALVETLLETFPAADCSKSLRQDLVREYERVAGDALGATYAWLNTQLADAGLAMASANDYAMLLAPGGPGTAVDGPIPARNTIWSDDNALTPAESSWRRGDWGGRGRSTSPLVSGRGDALRARARLVRESTGDPARRSLRDEEFLAVLSLLQGDPAFVQAGHDAVSVAPWLHLYIRQGAANLGMPPDTTRFSEAQEDAIDLVGTLFDRLVATHVFSTEARGALRKLVCPYLRLTLEEPLLFDAQDHPAWTVLSELVWIWDGADGDGEHGAMLSALAGEIASDIANEYHGDALIFAQAIDALRESLQPHRSRADVAAKRAGQAQLGRERLHAARRAADRALSSRIAGRGLLPTVAAFLDDQWRQSLVQAWLKEGPDSRRYADAVAVGDAIVAIDLAAAEARGGDVASGLIELEQQLRDCYVACGIDDAGARAAFAAIVAELVNPDAVRRPVTMTPLADGSDVDDAAVQVAPEGFEEDRWVLVSAAADQPARLVRIAWTSPLTGAALLVTRQGAKHALHPADALATLRDAGQLILRPAAGAVEGALSDLARA